ncbi:MAG: hypothetical protein H7Z20_03420 [Bdellovibrio sp.]|nr:hypothetical protein [Methylotenera sp.]
MSIALCMALVPISVFAAGLGRLNVMSSLGEPLKADIELIAVTPEDLNSITAAIASQEAYTTQGIEKPASHNSIKVSIAKNAAGAPILKLNSSQVISEPFLDMLIQVDWASGRLLREYTVLLDPPGYTGEADSSAQTAQAPIISTKGQNRQRNLSSASDSETSSIANDTPIRAQSSNKKLNKRNKPMPAHSADDVMAASTDVAGGEYTTQRGDSLAKIANEMKPEGISLEQMLVGLYQANPNAFDGKNMNRLKVGQIIRQPSSDVLSAVSSGGAKKEIKIQTANWNAYRNKLAGMVAESPAADTEANMPSAGGKIKTAAEDKSAPVTAGPKDVVKLSTGDSATSKADSANVKVFQDKITSLQEEATAREKSVKEAQDRSASLEKQIEDMQKLLALKNGAMADLQNQANTKVAGSAVETEKPAPVVVTPPAPAKSVEAVKPESINPEPAKPLIPISAPVEEPGFLTSMLSNFDASLLAPFGGALALLGGGWFYLRKKREKSLADFEQGIMTSGGLKANTVFGNTANASINSGDTSFLTDFSQSANGGMIDTNDVDPIAEAEVYMAYGRDAQAEEILKDENAKEPKRHELHLKLLEMYAASKNLSAFETVAGELYTSLGAQDATWAKVAEIGIKLEPNNPLYQVNSQPTGSLDATDFADSPLAAEKDLDFSFDNDALTKGFVPTGVAVVAGGAGLTAAAALIGTAAKDSFDLDMNPFADSNTTNASALKSEATNTDVADLEMFVDKKLPYEEVGSSVMESNATLDISGADHNMMDFDISGFGADAPTFAEVTPNATEDFGHTMPSSEMQSLDVPTFAEPQFMPNLANQSTALQASDLESSNVEFIDLQGNFSGKIEDSTESFEFPLAKSAESALDVGGLDAHFANVKLSDETDFDFDVPTLSPEAESFKNTDFSDANLFDLTTIDLDLNDSVTDSAADTAHVNATSTVEPIEVETKLDLVAAYMEMDDKEGAKELLDEVIKEGGVNQRKRAEELLVKLT